MDNQKNQQPRVMRINNQYTNEELRRQLRSAHPRRRYLGLILVTVVIALTIPAYGLIKSYEGLQNARLENIKTTASSENIQYQASSDQQLIKSMKNSFFMEKFARNSPYYFSKNGEKIFTVPSSSSALTTQNNDN